MVQKFSPQELAVYDEYSTRTCTYCAINAVVIYARNTCTTDGTFGTKRTSTVVLVGSALKTALKQACRA